MPALYGHGEATFTTSWTRRPVRPSANITDIQWSLVGVDQEDQTLPYTYDQLAVLPLTGSTGIALAGHSWLACHVSRYGCQIPAAGEQDDSMTERQRNHENQG